MCFYMKDMKIHVLIDVQLVKHWFPIYIFRNKSISVILPLFERFDFPSSPSIPPAPPRPWACPPTAPFHRTLLFLLWMSSPTPVWCKPLLWQRPAWVWHLARWVGYGEGWKGVGLWGGVSQSGWSLPRRPPSWCWRGCSQELIPHW